MPVRKEDKLGEIVGVRRRDGRMQIAVPGHERHGQRIACLVDEFVQVQFQHGGSLPPVNIPVFRAMSNTADCARGEGCGA